MWAVSWYYWTKRGEITLNTTIKVKQSYKFPTCFPLLCTSSYKIFDKKTLKRVSLLDIIFQPETLFKIPKTSNKNTKGQKYKSKYLQMVIPIQTLFSNEFLSALSQNQSRKNITGLRQSGKSNDDDERNEKG